ncbi:type VII secretion protein EccCa [Tenggerimyces flavus]|uniref:Type VII secretion protein EccCa n=1 Tax=Tenggerimyces flavus TaxID=1708749 RepID=A0ABV7YNR9_9ACTN|nr:type VII secretion protein EccCa [Tenggerimyces flavus]MBM7790172.1 S-DNA-T family DNA segregation ATPase FtsK/SpoIIIE [Tenggerimyces flavus]
MAVVIVKRPARRPAPDLPSGELVLEAPPEIPVPGGRQWMQALMVLPMAAMMGAMLISFSGALTGGLRIVVYGLFGAAMLGMVVLAILQGSGTPGRREMAQARRGYLRQLAQHRVRMVRAIERQRTAMAYLHPDPAALWNLVASYRLWERRRDDQDFGVARIGTAKQSAAITLVPPDTKPLEGLEPLAAMALRRFISTYSTVPGLPLAIAVNGFSRIYVRGDRTRSTSLVRALLAQLASLHAPDDLRIAACVAPESRSSWEWMKWLPHALHPTRMDALGSLRLVAPAITGIEAMLDDLLANRPRFDPERVAPTSGPYLVVVIDGGEVGGSDHLMTGGGVEGVSVIDLTTQPPRSLDTTAIVLDIDEDGNVVGETTEGDAELGNADDLSLAGVEALARELAPLRLTVGAAAEQPLSAELGLEDLLELGDPYSFDPTRTWVQRPNRDRLRVRIGIRADGAPTELDLKESAQEGMGPHGLLIGATGSGKSEMLRTLVLGLAVTHSPASLNFVLVDFKGGATFSRMDRLPHTSAMITNLADELHLVDRMTDALNGELVRRQEMLRAAGNYASLRDYEKARAAGAPLPEVPTLLVIVDEFSELLSAKPDFIDTFVQIGRVGRSLGVHLLLASQRLEEGRLRGLDAHLSYRIALRTFSDNDSRAVLGTGDAFKLPRPPGHGFVKSGTEPLVRFRSAYVSGVHQRAQQSSTSPAWESAPSLMTYSTDYRAPDVDEDDQLDEVVATTNADDAVGESLLDILVGRLAGRGTPAHQVWLPPLAESPTVGQVLGELVLDPERGLTTVNARLHGRFCAVAGIVDRPFDQRRDPLVLDLSAGAGHVVIVGAPHSGRSTTVQSIVTSLALTHTPAEVQFYCLDFGGGALASVKGLPHVGGVAFRQAVGAVRRTVAELVGLLARRERSFAEHEIEGMASYRRLRAAGQFAEDPYGDVFLVVDGWGTLKSDFEDLEAAVVDLAARGLSYGIHIMLTCVRPYELRMNIRDLLGSRVELRLGDPIDSMVDRLAALSVPEDQPGRGITGTKHQMLIALPELEPAGTADLVAAVADAWAGPAAPDVRLLPAQFPYADLPPRDRSDDTGHRLTVGIAERDLAPVALDFAAEPHVILLGDAESGKTTFLRVLARRIATSYEPERARIILVDHRRALLGDITSDHLIGYGTDLTSTTQLMQEAMRGMAERMPPVDVTPEQLRQRSWWDGPELYLLIDDYDLIVSQTNHPFLPLLDYLQHGRDIGLHVVVTRRMNGAGRALFEPFLARLRDVGSPGLMMSGDRLEGPLLGGLKPELLPPGRAHLVRHRGAPQLVQLALLSPAETEGAE